MVSCIIGSLFGSRPFCSAIVVLKPMQPSNAEVARCSVMLLMCSDVFGALICPLVSCIEFFSL